MKFRLTSQGESAIYHVHSENCRDAKREIQNGFDDDGVFDDIDDVVMFLFEDMIYEDIDFGDRTVEEARAKYYDELQIMPCAE